MLNKNTKYICKKAYNNYIEGEYYYIIFYDDYIVYLYNFGIFSLNKTKFVGDYPNFYEYFYTLQEQRKIKLLKITSEYEIS